MIDWRDHAEALWGPDWGLAMADVFGVEGRTVRRWRNGRSPAPDWMTGLLARLVGRAGEDAEALAFGALLRRMSQGDTIAAIQESIFREQEALRRLEAMMKSADAEGLDLSKTLAKSQ